jgi:hypothetical protein
MGIESGGAKPNHDPEPENCTTICCFGPPNQLSHSTKQTIDSPVLSGGSALEKHKGCALIHSQQAELPQSSV